MNASLKYGCLAVVCTGSFALAEPADDRIAKLKALSLEQLSEIEITIASKRPEKVERTPAAVYVITSEEIRRSGMTEVPELLRMVPGFHVARIDSARWAVSARGYNRRFADKLLVLLDGRNVYTELFSGVYWDGQLIPVENIDRIEIYRGPGGAIWGANAVTGVVNIITRDAAEAGPLVSLTAGSEGSLDATLRYGGTIGERAAYSIFAKGSEVEGQAFADGRDAPTELSTRRGGLRLDVSDVGGGELSLHLDAYDAEFTELFPPAGTAESDGAGHSLGARWAGAGGVELLVSYDHVERDGPSDGDDRDAYDIEYRHDRELGRHRLNWGAGYRRVEDDLDLGRPEVVFLPPARDNEILSAYVQDQFQLSENFALIAGFRVEENDYTGTEWLPSVRALWTPPGGSTLWAAYSRAVRTPGRFTTSVQLTNPLASFQGNPTLDSEEFDTWELGFRDRLGPSLSLDVALSRSRAEELVTLAPLGFAPPLVTFVNGNSADTTGVELAATLDLRDNWRLHGSYSYLDYDQELPGSVFGAYYAGVYPEQQAQLRSRLQFEAVETDVALYYVDSIAQIGVPSHLRLDVRLGWSPTPGVQLDLGARNLLDGEHLEFVDEAGVIPSQVQRELYLRLVWRD